MIEFEDYLAYKAKYRFHRDGPYFTFYRRQDANRFIKEFLRIRHPENDYYTHQIIDNDEVICYRIYEARPTTFYKDFVFEGSEDDV